MSFETIFFLFFSSIALTSAIFVIYSTNTIYSAFFLILVFTNITGLLLITEIEFISIMLIIIYVGAITVLFLFVIMMLDINLLLDKNNNNNFGYIPIIFLISSIFFIETFLIFSRIFLYTKTLTSSLAAQLTFFKEPKINYFVFLDNFKRDKLHQEYNLIEMDVITNIETLGQILYTYYSFFFLIAGLILLIALIGAVMLTKKEKKKNKFLTKNVYQQLSRNNLNAIFNAK